MDNILPNHMKTPHMVEPKPLSIKKLKLLKVATRPMLKYQPKMEEKLPMLKSPLQLVLILKQENQLPHHTEVTLMLLTLKPQKELNRLDHQLPQLPMVQKHLLKYQLPQELKHTPEILNTLLVERLIPLSHTLPQMEKLPEQPLITQ